MRKVVGVIESVLKATGVIEASASTSRYKKLGRSLRTVISAKKIFLENQRIFNDLVKSGATVDSLEMATQAHVNMIKSLKIYQKKSAINRDLIAARLSYATEKASNQLAILRNRVYKAQTNDADLVRELRTASKQAVVNRLAFFKPSSLERLLLEIDTGSKLYNLVESLKKCERTT